MKPRTTKSPLALTDDMAAALRVITLMPLLDAASIGRECGGVATTLEQLVTRGFVKTQPSRKIDGKATTLYVATLKGMDALDEHAPIPRGQASAPAAPMRTSIGYTCPELGRTCQRPGAYDAFALPSLIGNERRVPRSAA
jgi:hypothetical protein